MRTCRRRRDCRAVGRHRRTVAGVGRRRPARSRREAAVVARVALRYDDDKADLVHDEEYEAVLLPARRPVDPAKAVAVDYDDRDLVATAPGPCAYVLPIGRRE